MHDDKIPVKIFGQTYEILGNPGDGLYYATLAQYVEDKMKEIQENTNIVSSQKIAVLAALNICDELYQEREHKSSSSKNSGKRVEDLIKILDHVLEPGAGHPTPEPAPTRKTHPAPEKQTAEEGLLF